MSETGTETVTEAAKAPRFETDDWLAAAAIAAFFLVNLIGLDRVPFANADEAWIAEPGLRFWQGDGFVSRLHAGFFGTERHYLVIAPVFSLITGWMVWVFGHGIVQVRLVSLTMASLTAAFTYRLGRKLLTPRHGLIAALLLTWCRTGPYQWEARQSGIVLADFGRLARYDIAVPFFGLIGMLVLLPWLLYEDSKERVTPAQRRPRPRFVLAGACAGLATASHPMGLIWIAILAVSGLVATHYWGEWRIGSRWRTNVIAANAPVAWMLLGAGLVMLPWMLYAAAGWDDLIGQQQLHRERLRLGDPWFYVSNGLTEWRRYISIVRGVEYGIPGAWLLVYCGAAGLMGLIKLSFFAPIRLILAALFTGLLLLAIGERDKWIFYLAAMWPWIALTVANGIEYSAASRWRIARIAALLLLFLGCVGGINAQVDLARKANERTSYAAIADWLASNVPRDARVLGLPTWWFALDSHVRDYRSLTVPMFFLEIDDPTGRTFTQRMEAIDADVLLLDQAMLDYIHGPRGTWAKGPGTRNPGAEELERFVASRSVRKIDLDDPSYGRFEIHYLRR
jgi:hypothetical protein